MNTCKISEDDTTKALRALYMVPAPENNILDDRCDNAALGIGTATAPTFEGNLQSTTSGKLKGCHDGAYMAKNLELNDMSKPSKKLHAHSIRNSDGVDCFPKLKEKRKHIDSSSKGTLPNVLLNFIIFFLVCVLKVSVYSGGNVAKDQTPPMRSSIRVDHDNLRASKKIKKEFNDPAAHHSSEFVVCKSSSVIETAKNMHKHCVNSPGTGKYDSSSSGKRYYGEGKFFSDEVVKASCTGKSDAPDLSTKNKNSKQRLLRQHDPDSLTSNTTAKCITKQSESKVVKEKPRSELKFSKADKTAGVTGIGDVNIVAEKACRNVCHTQTTAAASSSSKVSNSHKDTADFQETRISPVDSVSSSLLRTDKNPLDQHKRHSLAVTENIQSQGLGKKGLTRPKRKYDFCSDSDQAKAHVSGCFNGDMDNHAVLTDEQDLKSAGLNNKDSAFGTKNGQVNPVNEEKVNSNALPLYEDHSHKQLTSHENGKTSPHLSSVRGQKINPCSVKGSKQRPPLNNTVNGDATCKAQQSEKAATKKLETKAQVNLNEGAPNPLNTSVLLKEARDLKHLSKRLKVCVFSYYFFYCFSRLKYVDTNCYLLRQGKVDDFESTSMCFEAALKFLNVASLWDGPSTDSSKQVDSIQAMTLYSETGNLCG
jgi:hypothetical protein